MAFISTEGRILRAETCQKSVEPVAFETFESMDGSSGTKTMQWGLGYQLYPFKLSSGEVKTAFGHSGVGGSLGMCIPHSELCIGITVNRLAQKRRAMGELVKTICQFYPEAGVPDLGFDTR